MKCFVCNADAEEGAILGDWLHITCPECGEYAVSGSMERMLENRKLDVDRTREWLRQDRRSGSTVPLLTTHNDELLV